MKISIITATYNSERTISDTLSSLEKQTYLDVEYIIVDGASKDNTLTVISQNS
ncbi:glycosyltransferase, partial [Yersinia pestis]